MLIGDRWDISENKKDDGENNASTTTWTGYSNGSSPGVTGHLAGLLGQNGNSSVSLPEPHMWRTNCSIQWMNN